MDALPEEVIIKPSNEQQPIRTQFMIFTLFGDYIVLRGGKVGIASNAIFLAVFWRWWTSKARTVQ